MSKSFKKYKRKARMHAVASALLLGLGVGLAAFAVLMLAFKLSGRETGPLYYLIFGGSALLISAVLYFVFMPSDKRLAKRLDSVFSLDEKVSTMIELWNNDDGLAPLQREDAEVSLGEKSPKLFRSKKLLAGLIVFCISVGCVLGAWAIPVKADSGEPPIDEFDKQWIITAIGELITTVENSYMDDGLKTSVSGDLHTLLDFVEGSEFLSEMKREAIKAVISINRALEGANSAESIAPHFTESQNELISALGKELADLSGSASKKALEALGEHVLTLGSSDASFVADEMNAYLQASGVRTDDAVYMLFKSVTAAIKSGSSNIEDEFKDAGKKLSAEVIVQNVNRSTVGIVTKKLCSLFGITEDDIATVDPEIDVDTGEREEGTTYPGGDGKEPENNIGSGGLGTGEIIYGSDDIVYDPYTDTYRPYGEIINEYFAKANEQITDGKTSEELSKAAEEYFGMLFGGMAKDE